MKNTYLLITIISFFLLFPQTQLEIVESGPHYQSDGGVTSIDNTMNPMQSERKSFGLLGNYSAKTLWRTRGGGFFGIFTVDANNDGILDIFSGAGAYNGIDGSLLWHISGNERQTETLYAGALNNTGIKVSILASSYWGGGEYANSTVSCLNASNGQLIWKRELNGSLTVNATVIDINDDKTLDVIIPTTQYYSSSNGIHYIYALNGKNGTLIWRTSIGAAPGGSLPFDVNQDGTKDVIIGVTALNSWSERRKVIALDGKTGVRLWEFQGPPHSDFFYLGFGHVGPNGTIAILGAGAPSGMIHALDPYTGKEYWNFSEEGGSINTFDVGDVSGDGKAEIVLGACYYFNGTVTVLQTNNSTVDVLYKKIVSTCVDNIKLLDLDIENGLDILWSSHLGEEDPWIHALNGKSGNELWKLYGDGCQFSITAKDINNDSIMEVLFATDDWKNLSLFLIRPYMIGPPFVDAGSDATVKVNKEVKYNSIARTVGKRIVSYSWDFDGDGTIDWNGNDNITLFHIFNETGVYNSILYAKDSDGEIGLDTRIITVVPNKRPMVNAGNDIVAWITDNVSFYGKAWDDDGVIIRYSWDYDGDGMIDWESSHNQISYHSYLIPGKYKAIFIVQDDDNATSFSVRNITIIEKKIPILEAGENITTEEGKPVSFFGKVKYAQSEIISYQWDYNGDGIIDWKSDVNYVTIFTYFSSGNYTAVFRVVDKNGLIGEDVRYVCVVPKGVPEKPDTDRSSSNLAIGMALILFLLCTFGIMFKPIQKRVETISKLKQKKKMRKTQH